MFPLVRVNSRCPAFIREQEAAALGSILGDQFELLSAGNSSDGGWVGAALVRWHCPLGGGQRFELGLELHAGYPDAPIGLQVRAVRGACADAHALAAHLAEYAAGQCPREHGFAVWSEAVDWMGAHQPAASEPPAEPAAPECMWIGPTEVAAAWGESGPGSGLVLSTVRLFVSSTFADFKAERAAFEREVYPALRRLCAEQGCRLELADLRWSIRDEDCLSHQVLPICLQEVDRCRRLCPGVFFVCLLGQRYGWRPLPPRLAEAEWSALQRSISAPQRALMARWYQQDSNTLPRSWRLRRVQGCSASEWARTERLLGDAVFSQPQHGRSVTQRELMAAASRIGEAPGCFAFVRTIEGIPEAAEGFRDLKLGSTRPDIQAGHLQRELVDCQLPSLLPADQICRVRTQWDPGSCQPSPQHLQPLCRAMFATLASALRAQIRSAGVAGMAADEPASHSCFRDQILERGFVGRESELQRLLRFFQGEGDGPRVAILHGEHGSGKTALLAKTIALLTKGWSLRRCQSDPNLQEQEQLRISLVVERFVGATPSSCDTVLLASSICQQLGHASASSKELLPEELRSAMEDWLRAAAAAAWPAGVALAIDSLDQLTSLDWLPHASALPPNVRILVSVASQSAQFGEARELWPTAELIEQQELSCTDRLKVVLGRLRRRKRTITTSQQQLVDSHLSQCGLPLYLSIIAERACTWASSDVITSAAIGDSIGSAISGFFAWLQDERNHPPRLLHNALSLLACAKNGLSVDELSKLLSDDEQVWKELLETSFSEPSERVIPAMCLQRLLADLGPFLVERFTDGCIVLAFYHACFSIQIRSLFLAKHDKLRRRHQQLASFFEHERRQSARPSLRVLTELPSQLLWASELGELGTLLCDLRFIAAMLESSKHTVLIQNYDQLLAHNATPDGLRESGAQLRAFVVSELHLLLHKPSLQLLLGLALNSPFQAARTAAHAVFGCSETGSMLLLEVLNKADQWDRSARITIPVCKKSIKPTASALTSQAAENLPLGCPQELMLGTEIAACCLLPGPSNLVTLLTSGKVQRWCVTTGKELNSLYYASLGRGRDIQAARQCVAALFEGGTVLIASALTLEHRCTLRIPILPRCIALTNDEQLLLGTAEGSVCKLALRPLARRRMSARVHRSQSQPLLSASAGSRGGSRPSEKERIDISLHALEQQTAHTGRVNWISCSSSAAFAASASSDNTVIVHSLAEPGRHVLLQGHTAAVLCCCWHQHDKLVSSSTDGTVRIWMRQSASSWKLVSIWNSEGFQVRFCPDGNRVIHSGAEGAILVSRQDGDLLQFIKAHGLSSSRLPSFVVDDSVIVVGRHSVKCWQDAVGRHAHSAGDAPHQAVTRLVPAGIAALANSRVVCASKLGLEAWHVSSSAGAQTLTRDAALIEATGGSKPVTAVGSSEDGSLLGVGYSEELRLWRMDGRQMVEFGCVRRHRDSIVCVAFSPDRCFVATSSKDSSIKLYSLPELLETATLAHEAHHCVEVRQVAFDQDSIRLASVTTEGQLTVWLGRPLVTERLVRSDHSEQHPASTCTAAKFGPNNLLVSCHTDSTLRAWQAEDGADGAIWVQLREWRDVGIVKSLAVLPTCGPLLVAALSAETALVLDPMTGREACRFSATDTLRAVSAVWLPAGIQEEMHLILGGVLVSDLVVLRLIGAKSASAVFARARGQYSGADAEQALSNDRWLGERRRPCLRAWEHYDESNGGAWHGYSSRVQAIFQRSEQAGVEVLQFSCASGEYKADLQRMFHVNLQTRIKSRMRPVIS